MGNHRVCAYIDGFNLYFGIVEAGFKGKWLNIDGLVKSLLKPEQILVEIKYFTSNVSHNPEKQKRQRTYIEALETIGITIIYGKYQAGTIECKRCGNIWKNFNEKMTDVNIATHLLVDAYQDRYDSALLLSGDSDLVPPAQFIKTLFPKKRIVIAFPPSRYNNSLASVAQGNFIIGRKKIIDNQLPLTILKPDGFKLTKPAEW